ncbi:Flp family type IVb pilin [Pseudomonas helleri]|jgi:pilus assembly protein Flp/PilA|uniref:Flp family type IVb pilin n=1 Tax=Pseudomonas helleri TaxID=1608996 RepID=A0A6A7ZEF4_9PSED|nr:Flp family type IVb pilin [Pseudomonas helleri]MQT36368.1 Flp family type IVb pilin [Pseudomonas helleri]MQU21414.1 Flp family type IVb pilin [Pseudomonas helleri]MQU44237.1 Flp family type IVb pilin [Pseudomonas helleri]MQU59717.1 Flp family type IVb pilin [Pseudomonas helleri]
MFSTTVLKLYVPANVFLTRQAKLFLQRTEGASGIEYAIIAAMVAIALAAFVTPISGAISTMFTTIKDAVTKPA